MSLFPPSVTSTVLYNLLTVFEILSFRGMPSLSKRFWRKPTRRGKAGSKKNPAEACFQPCLYCGCPILACLHKHKGEKGSLSAEYLLWFVLFGCQLRGLHLFILFKSRPTVRQDKVYDYDAAKTLKKALVLDGGCNEGFYFGYHAVHYRHYCSEIQPEFCPDLANRYLSQYTCEEEEANEEKLNRILESLVSVFSVYLNDFL